MRIKSYFTDSVQEAIEHARVELGPDAMLMNSKKTEPELRALGAYEVVFGVMSEVASASSTVLPKRTASAPEIAAVDKKRPLNGAGGISKGLAALLTATQPALVATTEMAANAAAHSTVVTPLDQQSLSPVRTDTCMEPVQPKLFQNGAAPISDVSRELADLREQLETIKRSMLLQSHGGLPSANEMVPDGIAAAATPDANLDSEPAALPLSNAQEIRQQLVTGGLSDELASEIAEAVEERISAESNTPQSNEGTRMELREAALYAELSGRFRVAPGILLPETAAGPLGRTILFAGPAGSGKTTSLLKVALRHSLDGRVPLQILSLDTLRVGGWEQLAAYARIAGLPFQVIHNPASLGQVLAGHRGKKLILIDTPGLSPAEWLETPELAAWVSREMARDTTFEVQLVLSAAMRFGSAQRALEQFRALRPAKLLLTHLDEVDAPGAVLELAVRSGLPLSFLAAGQQIPEDIEEASQERLIQPIATAFSSCMASAA
jgi:flagellar biosynthesis protein FlhF